MPNARPSLELEAEGDEGPVDRSELFFDPWLICDHPAIDALVSHAVDDAERAIAGRRVRRRRVKDRLGLQSAAGTLVANAAYALAKALDPPTVAISLAKPSRAASRYDGSRVGQLDLAIEALSPSIIVLRKSRRKGIASTIEAGEALSNAVTHLDDFGLHSFTHKGGETIIVRRIHRDYASDTRIKEDIEYADDANTVRLRAEVQRINEALEATNLTYDPSAGPPVELRRR